MDWKNQLTKTPYLVLFIVLISMGVGTASALITITLAGNVIVTGNLDMTGGDLSIENPGNEARILLGTDDIGNNDVIVFDDGSKVFFWREANDRFEINEDLAIQGDLNLAVPFGNDDDRILFDDGSKILMWDESESRFDFSNDVNCPNCIIGFYIVVDSFSGDGVTEMRTATCDVGDLLSGGGYSAGSGDDFPIRSVPQSSQSWRTLWLTSSNGVTYSSFAVCADYEPAHVP